MKQLSAEQIASLNAWLPKKALKAKPGAADLSSINAMYVIDRLNEVFGIGAWQVRTEAVNVLEEQAHNRNGEYTRRMPIVKVTLDIPEYNIHLECFGGNDNSDFGDAYKGGMTDAITKIGSWLGIGAGIWRGEYGHKTPDSAWTNQAEKPAAAAEQEEVSDKDRITIVLNFLASNQAALDYYLGKYNLRTLDEFKDEEFLIIYSHLKQHKKI